MHKTLGWRDHIFINIYWLGLSISAGVITPVLLPYLVTLFVSHDQKNTYLALLRVAGLAVAMLVQPLAGMYSDRSTHRWGRRRPFILWGTILDLVFLAIIGASVLFIGSPLDQTIGPLLGFSAAFAVLLLGLVLLQASSNTAQGAQQGLIPDLVPDNQRGTSSGVKSLFEILPSFLAVFIGPIIDAGRIWLTVGICARRTLAREAQAEESFPLFTDLRTHGALCRCYARCGLDNPHRRPISQQPRCIYRFADCHYGIVRFDCHGRIDTRGGIFWCAGGYR
jgi:MFS family permease